MTLPRDDALLKVRPRTTTAGEMLNWRELEALPPTVTYALCVPGAMLGARTVIEERLHEITVAFFAHGAHRLLPVGLGVLTRRSPNVTYERPYRLPNPLPLIVTRMPTLPSERESDVIFACA